MNCRIDIQRSLQCTPGTHGEEQGFKLGFGDGQVEEEDCMRNFEKFVTIWMNSGDIILSEISQMHKKTNII